MNKTRFSPWYQAMQTWVASFFCYSYFRYLLVRKKFQCTVFFILDWDNMCCKLKNKKFFVWKFGLNYCPSLRSPYQGRFPLWQLLLPAHVCVPALQSSLLPSADRQPTYIHTHSPLTCYTIHFNAHWDVLTYCHQSIVSCNEIETHEMSEYSKKKKK